MGLLLERVAAGARPGPGGARALAEAIAVLRHCTWVEGDLRLEIEGEADGATSTLHVFSEQGGVRERLFPGAELATPFVDLAAAIEGYRELFQPLAVGERAGKIVLAESGSTMTVPPPLVEIADDSLDWDPHRRPTVKRKAFILPEARRRD